MRERVFAGYFGTSLFASAFRAALRMPNVLQNLLGEGTLSASFIPVYAALLERGEDKAAGKVAGAVLALLIALAGTLTLIGVLLAPVLVDIFFAGFDGELRDVTVVCIRIIFPMTGILVLSAWALGILNSHRRFFLSYVAPVVWNAAMISTLLLLGRRLDARGLVIALSWGALAGGLLQFTVQLPWLLRLERDLEVRWAPRLPGVRQVISNAGPAILGRGVVQLSAWVDVFLASWLFSGAIAALGYAQTLYVLPVSLFGMAVAAAELPEMARQRTGATEALTDRLNAGLRQIALFVVPSTAGYLLLGDVIVAALYQTGEFGRADTLLVALVLGGYTIGLMASTATRLYASALYALNDTRTPAKIAFVRVILAAAIGVGLMLWLENYAVTGPPFRLARAVEGDTESLRLGVVGLAIAAGIAAWMEWLLLRRAIRTTIGDARVGSRTLMRLIAAALVAGIVGRGIHIALPPLHPALAALLTLVPFGIVYFGLASALGVEDAGRAVRRIGRRFGIRF